MSDARAALLAMVGDEEIVEADGVGRVLVRGMSVAARDAVQAAAMRGEPWRPAALRACLFDPDSKEPLFGPGDDIGAISAPVMEPYVDTILRLSKTSEAEQEELEGN